MCIKAQGITAVQTDIIFKIDQAVTVTAGIKFHNKIGSGIIQ